MMSQGEVLKALRTGSMTTRMMEELTGKASCGTSVAKLVRYGEVIKKRVGTTNWYSLNPERFKE